MTLSELYRFGVASLQNAHIENAAFDATCLLEKCTGLSKTDRAVQGKTQALPRIESAFRVMIQRRVSREPLQYILGEWEFYGNPFKVGRGVLIPRPETELLVDTVIDYVPAIGKTTPVIMDLCAGSGCVGISLAKCLRQSQMFLVENSSEALQYLEINIALNGVSNAVSMPADVFDDFDLLGLPFPDVIVSNPPYVSSEELAALSAEVRQEPIAALDGGLDGLSFYRLFRDRWYPLLNPGGVLVMEVGEKQADEVLAVFSNTGNIRVLNDLSGVCRVVCVQK